MSWNCLQCFLLLQALEEKFHTATYLPTCHLHITLILIPEMLKRSAILNIQRCLEAAFIKEKHIKSRKKSHSKSFNQCLKLLIYV